MENWISRIRLEEAAGEVAETTQGTDISGTFGSFMGIFMIVVGIFALYSAFTGKGPAYKNDYPAAMQEEHTKMLRKFLWVIGPLVLASGILDYMASNGMLGEDLETGIIGYISAGVSLLAIAIYVFLFRRKFKKYLK